METDPIPNSSTSRGIQMKQKGASVPPNIAMAESTPIHMNTGQDKDPVHLLS